MPEHFHLTNTQQSNIMTDVDVGIEYASRESAIVFAFCFLIGPSSLRGVRRTDRNVEAKANRVSDISIMYRFAPVEISVVSVLVSLHNMLASSHISVAHQISATYTWRWMPRLG